MADYWGHWLKIGEKEGAQLPRIYLVNWFRKDADGKFMWPGFGDNSRVIEWIFGRCDGEDDAVRTPIGFLPAPGAIDTNGLDLTDDALAALLAVEPAAWVVELQAIEEHYAKFGSRVPAPLVAYLEHVKKAVSAA
jgi:phosphoenolpyruvate carboxykinase (GTP)